jgi:hypothetical protein
MVIFFKACAKRISVTWLKGDFMCTFLPLCCRSFSVRCRCVWRPAVRSNHEYVPCPCLFTTIGRYYGCSVCSVVCGSIIRRPISCLTVSVWKNLNIIVITYYKCVVMFELLVSSVLHLCDCLHVHHDCPPSCAKLSLYIWETTKSSTEHTQKYWKNCGDT